jgi:hypothetical protein
MEPSDQGWAGYSRKPTSTSNVPSVLQRGQSSKMALHAANSPAQAELLSDPTASQRSAPLLQTCLSEIAVFKVLNIGFDEFAGVVALGAAGSAGKLTQPALRVGIETDG